MSRQTKLGFKVRSSSSPVEVKVSEEVENTKVDRGRSVDESRTGVGSSLSEPLLDTLICHEVEDREVDRGRSAAESST